MATASKNGRTRANGEGSIRIRGNSVEFRITGEDGKSKSMSEKINGRTKAELRARLTQLAGKPQTIDGRITLSSYADVWYAEMEKRVEEKTLEESSLKSLAPLLVIIKRAWGNERLDKLSAKEIEDGFRDMRQLNGNIYSMSVKKHCKTVLSQIYRAAVKAKLVDRSANPMLDVAELITPADQPLTPAKDAYSIHDTVKIVDYKPKTKYGHAIRVAVATGIRCQELLPLRVEDFEPDGTAFSINKAVKRGLRFQYTGRTKTKSSTRFVEVPAFAQSSVLWLLAHAKNGYVMPNKAGGYITYSTYIHGYYAAMKDIGVKVLPPHCMRHTFATNYKIRMHIDDLLVMAATGHTDRKTMEGYTHTQSNELRDMADKYDAFITSSRKNVEEPKKDV